MSKKKFVLRPYQLKAVEKLLWSKQFDGADLCVLPSGAGKSIVIAELSQRIDSPILILQPTREILLQNVEKMQTYVEDSEIGIYSASVGRKDLSTYTFATIGSIYRKPELFKHFPYIIIDECHLVNPKNLTGMYTTFLKGIGDPKIIGLTATPYRLDVRYERLNNGGILTHTVTKLINRTKGRFWHRLIFNINTQELIDQGYLVPLRYIDRSIITHDKIPTNKSKSDFNLVKYEKKIASKLESVLEAIFLGEELADHVLVFCSSVDQAEHLQSLIAGSEVVTAKSSKKVREDVIEGFRSGRIKTVLNVGVLTCLSDKMEILTRNKGWVTIDEISRTDMVAQYKNGEITFSEPIRIVKKDVVSGEEMVRLNGRYQSFTVTPTHNMLIAKRKNLPLSKLSAKQCVNKRWFIPVSGEAEPEEVMVTQPNKINRSRFIASNSFNYRKKGLSDRQSKLLAEKEYIRKSNLKYKNPKELTIDECMFIGFWLGDGCVSSGRYAITQSLRTPKMVEWIDDLVQRLGYSNSRKEYAGGTFFIFGKKCLCSNYVTWSFAKGTGGHKQHANGIFPILPYLNKEGADYLWGISKEQYYALIKGLWMADGWHGNAKEFDGSKIVGATKELFELLQTIGICRGFRVTIKEVKKRRHNRKQLYSLSMAKKSLHQMSNDRMEFVRLKNKGRVWCVTTPEGTIITRDRGSVTIMGNTGFDFPSLNCIVLLRPTKSIGLYYQMAGRGIRTATDKGHCNFIDLTDTVKTLGRVETIKMVKREKWELESEKGSWHNRCLYSYMLQDKKSPQL